MKKLIAILLLLPSIALATVTLPTMSTVPNRTTCTAPCAVFFDASQTTSTATTTPYHSLQYNWIFGDSTSGTLEYGSKAGQSKNFATGPIATHVYETAGTYTVTLSVKDSTPSTSTGTVTITVTAANTTFSGSNTTCVNASGSDHTGCPLITAGTYADSAACVSAGRCVTNADFDSALGSYLGSGKRVVFKGGDTFVASATTTLTNVALAHIGYYGTGRPKVTTAITPGDEILRIAGTSSDIRVAGLEFDGEDNNVRWMSFAASAWSNVLLLDNYAHRLNGYLAPDWNYTGGSGIFIFGNRLEDPRPGMTLDMTLVGKGSVIALVNNNYSMDAIGQQVIRINHSDKFIISNNDVSGGAATKETIAVRSENVGDSTLGLIADNNISVGPAYVGIFPSSANTGLGIFDVIIERNYIYSANSGETTNAIQINAERVSVRNNIIDGTDVDMDVGISLRGTNGGLSLPSKDVWVYNNTAYTAQSSGSFTAISVDTTASTGNVIKNNLVYSPNITATAVSDTGAVATKSNNTAEGTGAGSVKTSPSFSNTASAPQGFAITGSSYADNGGTAAFPATYSDFFNCFDKTAAQYRIGAVVRRADAICTGAP